MELFHLHYFLAVADELNLTRAAARLHLAASPLSRRIRDLERELGTPLFVRCASAELARSVGRGDLDLAFVHGRYDDDPQLAQRRVDSRPAGVAVGHGLGFDDRAGIRLDELTDLPYVSIRYDAAPSVYRATGELLARHGVHGRIELDTHNPGDLTHVVAAGQAFTLVGLGSGATHKAFVGEPVHVLPVLGADVRIGTEAVWRTDRAGADDVVRLLVAASPGPGDGGPA